MKINTLTLLLLLCFSLQSDAQVVKKRCAFDSIYQHLQTDSTYLANRHQLEKNQPLLKDNSDLVIVIPVVVHLIYKNATENISDQQILSQIDVLNEDFRMRNADTTNVESGFSKVDARIEFCLAKYDPNGDPTTGIERYKTNINEIGNTQKYYTEAPIWDRDSYLNIWVCNLGSIAGFSHGPGAAANIDGIVVHYLNFGRIENVEQYYDLGRTATHEIGHWLNLIHPWGLNGGCNDDDEVADTPLQKESYDSCPPPPMISCGSKDMLSNYMGYVDDACMGNFTNGQKERMRDAILTYRPSLLQSTACGPVGIAKNNPLKDGVMIFPNPTTKKLFIALEKNIQAEKVSIDVFNINGKKVAVAVQKSHQGFQLNFEGLETGTYFVAINNEKHQLLKKVILIP